MTGGPKLRSRVSRWIGSVGTFGLRTRIERLESLHDIQQLTCRHAYAIDTRDVELITQLFVDDCDFGRYGRGAEGARAYVDDIDRRFYRTIHMVVGHTIELDGPDRATGVCYVHAEHEMLNRWMVLAECFFDTYVRTGGRWCFQRRQMELWYAREMTERPSGPDFLGGFDSPVRPRMPVFTETWHQFWLGRDAEVANVTAHPGLSGNPTRREPGSK